MTGEIELCDGTVIDVQPINEYPHQIVITSETECSCGQIHEVGDAVWGGRIEPWEEMIARIEELHDGPKEVIEA